MSESRAFSVTADGLTYAGIEWGEPDGYPILALHGWLDNALSFSVLAPFLSEYRLIALDLSGQGLSDHRSSDATYHIWDDVPQLLSVVTALGLDQLAVLGHSRGAAIAVLLATALEDRCARLVLLDGMLPRPTLEESAVEQFLQSQRDHRGLSNHQPRTFEDIEGFVSARVRLGFSESSARLLAPRALREVADGWALVHDPRLNHASAVKLSPGMCSAFYAAMTKPTLALVAEEGLRVKGGLRASLAAVSDMPNCRVETVPGSHHSHMEDGAQHIAEQIAVFIGEADLSRETQPVMPGRT